jgi:glycopeptide antibiotics resistance protein
MASRSHFAAPLLLAVFVGLIVYVSLYPFRFAAHGPTMVEALRLLTWKRASHSEMYNNVLLYLPFGFCAALLVEPRIGRIAGIVFATIAGVALSLNMELLQASIAMRVTSLSDFLLNVTGALGGAVLGSVWHAFGASVTPPTDPRNRSRAVTLLIVVLWLLARLWPLIPDPGLRQLKAAVRPLFSPRIDGAELGAFLLGWLVVAQTVFHLARRQRAVDVLLILIAIVLVGRTFTEGNTLVTAEVAAIALLLPVLVVLSRVPDGARAAVVATLLAAWLAWIAVAPLLKASTGMGADLPALTEFIARNPPPPVQLAGKAFSYVALGWLLAGAGLLPHVAAGVTFLLVVLLTLLQLSAPAPAFGWVDVLIAAAAAVVVARWMPNNRGHSAFQKK